MLTEKEKQQRGELYNAMDKSFVAGIATGKKFSFEYNNLHPSQQEERYAMLKKYLGRVGENVIIQNNFFCDFGTNIEIGDNFFSNHNCVMLDCAKITIGNNVFIAPNCGFYTASHPFNVEQRNNWMGIALPITIGNNVWIGGNVCVMPGVTIGNNCIIGAGSVVTKDIPPGKLAYGNPCKIIKDI